jgi:uncharacterized protein (TIGR01319 family)
VTPRWAWLFDIGSTFTKVTVVDLDDVGSRYRAQAPTTVTTDVRRGFQDAIEEVHAAGGPRFEDAAFRAAGSSAAGGLVLVVSGLVPRLSAEAAGIAALGAGAKLVGALSFGLNHEDIGRLGAWRPDLVLLAGGTDGGDTETLLANARMLAAWRDCPTVIVAGNREVSGAAGEIIEAAGGSAVVVPNILPAIDSMVVEPARDAIRTEFLRNIVKAKGIEPLRESLDADIAPTPAVVLDAVRFVAEHVVGGGLLVVEVGGATTNVHSSAPTVRQDGVVQRGLLPPDLHRTVEGDLGVRWNAATILELGGGWFAERVGDDARRLEAYVERLAGDPWVLPETDEQRQFDALLAAYAARTGILRHCGRQREVMLPEGPVLVQEGKDMRGVDLVIGTGGALIMNDGAHGILEHALGSDDPFALVPSAAPRVVDHEYLMYAVGLLAAEHHEAAAALAESSLVPSSSIAH